MLVFIAAGYIYGCIGTVERYIGSFNDPYLLAFRGVGPKQPLYIVAFNLRDVWGSYDTAMYTGDEGDSVTLEIYHNWLQSPEPESIVRDTNTCASSSSTTASENISKPMHEHIHDHNPASVFTVLPHSGHDESKFTVTGHPHGGHEHGHVHESRCVVEVNAVQKEGNADRPGKVVGEALLRLLEKKGVLTMSAIQKVVETLENQGRELKGADLVLKCWTDDDFRQRLLADGMI